jgi:hypothetical protein
MSIMTGSGRCLVKLGYWSDEFACVDDAVELIRDAVYGDVRVKEEACGLQTRWLLQRRLADNTWLEQPSAASVSPV